MRAKDIKLGQTAYVSLAHVDARSDWRPCVPDGSFVKERYDLKDDLCPVTRDRTSGQLIVSIPLDHRIAKNDATIKRPHDFVTVTLFIGTDDTRHTHVPENLQHSRK